jgi:hypothetical protein
MRLARVRARRDGAIRKGETVSEEQQAAEAAPEYAVVELMGHVRHVGRLTEVDRFGSKMGRIDIPKGGKFEDGFTSVFFLRFCDLSRHALRPRHGRASESAVRSRRTTDLCSRGGRRGIL